MTDHQRDSRPALGALYCPTCESEEASGEICPRDGTRLVRLASDRDPMIGRNLDDRFTIEEKLGSGGMGSVYRARQHSVGRDVAIKVVNPGLVTDPTATKRFLREAKLASRLSHPNVVQVLDFGQTSDGLFYLVMELVQGRTLHAALLEGGRLKLDRVVRIISQICDALEGAHSLPMMHRDLKPANIMLLSAGRDLVKVLDFGLAKSLAVDATSTTMTSAGALLGTPTFMPPEVANGEPYDERADLYSLGCILYLLVSGRPPFVTDSVPEMIALHGSATPEPVKNVPWAFAQVIEKLLRKDPADRYPSAVAVRNAIEQALDTARSTAAVKADTHDQPVPEAIVAARARRERMAGELPLAAPTRPSEEQLTARRAAVAAPSLDGSADALETSASSPRLSDEPTPTLAVRARPIRMLVALAVTALVVIAGAAWLVVRDPRPAHPPPHAQPAIVPDAAVAPAAIVTPIEDAAVAADSSAVPAVPPVPIDAAIATRAPIDAATHHNARPSPPPPPPRTVTHAAPVDAAVAPVDAATAPVAEPF